MTPLTPRAGAALALVAILAVLSGGCGPRVGSISGKVTYNGKALKGGNVSFVSDGGQSFASTIKEDGTYSIPDLKSGTYKVCVETESLKPPATQFGTAGGKDTAKPGGSEVPEGYTPSGPPAALQAANAKKYVMIPRTYADPNSTDLTYEFKGGSDTHNIDLK